MSDAEVWIIEWLDGVLPEHIGKPDAALTFSSLEAAQVYIASKKRCYRHRIVRYVRASERPSVIPPYSSIVGQMAVHRNGHICQKWMTPELYDFHVKRERGDKGAK